mgnify:CR=1 FL=1
MANSFPVYVAKNVNSTLHSVRPKYPHATSCGLEVKNLPYKTEAYFPLGRKCQKCKAFYEKHKDEV